MASTARDHAFSAEGCSVVQSRKRYGPPGEKVATHCCKAHAPAHFVNFPTQMCKGARCNSHALYGVPGGKAEFCARCFPPGVEKEYKRAHYDVCTVCGKGSAPHYGIPEAWWTEAYGGTPPGKRTHCRACADAANLAAGRTVVWMMDKRCDWRSDDGSKGCTQHPAFALPGQPRRRCRAHILEGMCTVLRHCVVCETEFPHNIEKQRQPNFGAAGGPATHCNEHKLAGMENVTAARCEAAGCSARAYCCAPGSKRPRFCPNCAPPTFTRNMRKCVTCGVVWVYRAGTNCRTCKLGYGSKKTNADEEEVCAAIDAAEDLAYSYRDCVLPCGRSGAARPDFWWVLRVDAGHSTHVACEVDEYSHDAYAADAEIARELQLVRDSGARELTIVRYNPHAPWSRRFELRARGATTPLDRHRFLLDVLRAVLRGAPLPAAPPDAIHERIMQIGAVSAGGAAGGAAAAAAAAATAPATLRVVYLGYADACLRALNAASAAAAARAGETSVRVVRAITLSAAAAAAAAAAPASTSASAADARASGDDSDDGDGDDDGSTTCSEDEDDDDDASSSDTEPSAAGGASAAAAGGAGAAAAATAAAATTSAGVRRFRHIVAQRRQLRDMDAAAAATAPAAAAAPAATVTHVLDSDDDDIVEVVPAAAPAASAAATSAVPAAAATAAAPPRRWRGSAGTASALAAAEAVAAAALAAEKVGGALAAPTGFGVGRAKTEHAFNARGCEVPNYFKNYGPRGGGAGDVSHCCAEHAPLTYIPYPTAMCKGVAPDGRHCNRAATYGHDGVRTHCEDCRTPDMPRALPRYLCVVCGKKDARRVMPGYTPPAGSRRTQTHCVACANAAARDAPSASSTSSSASAAAAPAAATAVVRAAWMCDWRGDDAASPPQCTAHSTFGYVFTPPRRCRAHRAVGMVHLAARCTQCKRDRKVGGVAAAAAAAPTARPHYGFRDGEPLCCEAHKKPGMRDVMAAAIAAARGARVEALVARVAETDAAATTTTDDNDDDDEDYDADATEADDDD